MGIREKCVGILLLLVLGLYSCSDGCYDAPTSYEMNDFQNISCVVDSVNGISYNRYLKADSIYIVYPKVLKINNANTSKIPISHETNAVKVVYFHHGLYADTVNIGYTFVVYKEKHCYELFGFYVDNPRLLSNTFGPEYRVTLGTLEIPKRR